MATLDDGPGGGHVAASPSVAALRSSLAELIEESQALRTDVHSAELARKRASQINLAVLGLLGLFVAMLLVVTYQNNQLAHEVAKTNQTMADCTTPGGTCYTQSSRRTGEAIANIIRAEIFMAECARLFPGEAGPSFDRKLEACVRDRLNSDQLRNPAATPSPAPKPS